jgi:UDP-N-acetylmuramoylalanine--D-glutamate ligase
MKSSLILGYGSTGQDIEQYLISQNKNYLIHDDKEDIDKKYKFSTESINNIETIFVSPGVKKDHEILRMASSSGIKIMTDIELFSEKNNLKLIGVTGTNGKTSFVTLLDKILNKYDIKSKTAGNIGNSPLNLISDSNDLDYLILELSSFQLTHMKKIELEMAVVLNIYQDHIDWHETFEQYVFSKLKIFNFSTNQKYNFLGPVDSQVKTEEILPKNVRNFNEEKFNLNNYFDDFVSIFIDVCKEFSIPKDEVLNFLTSQSSIEHRFEHFHTKNGVKFINDSKSTNLESVNKASYKVKNCLLIMHGLLKGIDINRLSPSNEVKEIMVPKNSEFDINSNNFLVVEYENFEDLKKYIKNNYKNFDTVLFSCGGSSFSNFKNYMERGEYFKEMIVGEIN